MRRSCLVALLAVAFCPVQAAAAQDFDVQTIRASDVPHDAPRFEAYATDAVYAGPVAVPDTEAHPRSRVFRTAIRADAARGVDFAGHYTLVSWGCGSGCSGYAIVDARSGRVFHADALGVVDHLNVAHDEFASLGRELVDYRADSRLLVVIGGIDEDPARRGISYFVWEDERLQRIRFVHKPYE